MEIKSIKKSLMKKDKRGIMGLDIAKTFVITLMVLLIVGVLTVIVLKQLGDTSIVSSDNDTENIINNGTAGLSDFFSNTGTWLALVGVVILVMIIFVVINVVQNRSEGGTSL